MSKIIISTLNPLFISGVEIDRNVITTVSNAVGTIALTLPGVSETTYPTPIPTNTVLPASEVLNTAAGNITSLTVQDALNELDILKAGTGQTLHLGTTSVAINRASAAIALTGITSIDGSSASCSGNSATATTASACSGNSATATTASACSGNSATASVASSASASNITSTPYLTIVSTNVQAALNETTDKVAKIVLLALSSSAPSVETAVLVAGNIIVTDVNITADSNVLFNRTVNGGTLGTLSYSLQVGASITFHSSSATDTSTINYIVF